MPSITVPKTPLSLGPGYLYYAATGTALPANTVVGSVFTDTWASAGAWLPWGVTREGHEFQYTINTDTVEAAEYFDPLVIVTTGRAAQMTFECMTVIKSTMARALNGGGVATSGSGTTLLTTVTPPAAGSARRKGNANAGLTMEFHAELPSSGYPFIHYFAGAARGA